MTRRIVLFVCANGEKYVSDEFNGDKEEFAMRGGLDSCDKNWPEIEPLFRACKTVEDFAEANETAQGFYHSFLPGAELIPIRKLENNEEVFADEVIVLYECPDHGVARYNDSSANEMDFKVDFKEEKSNG